MVPGICFVFPGKWSDQRDYISDITEVVYISSPFGVRTR